MKYPRNNAPITNTSTEALQILHQNIQGLRWKSNEVLSFLYPSFPCILCFTEHHLNQHDIELLQIDIYIEWAKSRYTVLYSI
jgi:hypothetical protein